MTKILAWLLSRPLVTHTLLAAFYTAVLALIVGAVLQHFDVQAVPVLIFVAVLAGSNVSTFFYGREAGQKEHDLKHEIPQPAPPRLLAWLGTKYAGIRAWTGAEFMFLWGSDNLSQWGVAAGSSAAVAIILTVLGA